MTSFYVFGSFAISFGTFIVFIVFYALNIIGMYFYSKSFNLLANYTNINLFKLAGKFMFWGAVGIVFFGLGMFAIIIGWLLLSIAFFILPEKSSEQ